MIKVDQQEAPSDERLKGWIESWAAGRKGFHREMPYEALVEFFPRFTEGLNLTATPRVLVPLCGKSVDLSWLASQGLQVCGAEGVPQAIQELFGELGVEAQREQLEKRSSYHHGALSIVDGDFLTLDADEVGCFDLCWDRASMIALPEKLRSLYVERIISLVKPGGKVLLVTYEIERDPTIGPPYLVSEEEVQSRYAPFAKVECLRRVPWGEIGGARSAEATFLITRHHTDSSP
ncbi:MAG: hypothetical protein VYD19_00055 [Myxococcota bacterium]|nr:hypothetical protein [Myxococcota bacterium]